MTTYGGYQNKTSYGGGGGGGGGGDDAGGFLYGGGSQGGSQGAGGGAKAYEEESLRPVTIKQILECEEPYPGNELIDGAKVTQITFVGQIRGIAPQATNVTYRLEDGTGRIEVKKWIDASGDGPDLAEAAAAGSGLSLDQYVRVWGRLKIFNDKKHVSAHVIRPVKDLDEVAYHMLEAAAVHLYFRRGPPGQQNGNGAGAAGAGDSMFVDGGYGGADNGAGAGGAKLSGASVVARKMYNFLANAPGGNEGVHLNVIASGSGLSSGDVMAAADELLAQGVIYTTVDDETWAILEY